MRLDTHVHTLIEGDKQPQLPVEELLKRASDVGLDGLIMTEHNTVRPNEEFYALREQAQDLVLFRGVEVGCADGFHYLVYGSLDFLPLVENLSPQELVQEVHAEDGFVAIAHPYRSPDDVLPGHVYRLDLDGVEVKSFNLKSPVSQEKCLQLAETLNCWGIAGTDHHAHCPDRIGRLGIELERTVTTERDLVREMKEGAFTIFDTVDF